jgi:hypothetical protein
MRVDGEPFGSYSVIFSGVTEQMRRCWNDEQVTTEHGAYGIALLMMVDQTEYTVIERSRKGTGFDYWLGTEPETLFQGKARLEVSGIRSGDEQEIRSRTRQKRNQIRPATEAGPAYTVVVEFSTPRAQVTLL